MRKGRTFVVSGPSGVGKSTVLKALLESRKNLYFSYADKVAVDEETVRLRSHVAQLRTMLASDEPMGRKMDFLIQEVNRESNTIGSKCNDVAIANVVVGLKAEVEKMREQVQNVE